MISFQIVLAQPGLQGQRDGLGPLGLETIAKTTREYSGNKSSTCEGTDKDSKRSLKDSLNPSTLGSCLQ